jgi:hypothetical protein
MISLMKSGRSRDLENAIARAQPGSGSGHPPANLPPGVFASGYSGPSFFERLFGPPTPPAPVGRRAQQQQPRRATR